MTSGPSWSRRTTGTTQVRDVAVIDASVLVDMLVGGPRGARAEAIVAGFPSPVAPELLDVEVCSAIARLERSGELSPAEADAAVGRLGRFPVRRVSSALLAPAAWRHRGSLRVSDAFYVACAKRVGVPLITSDARLARAPVGPVTVTLVR